MSIRFEKDVHVFAVDDHCTLCQFNFEGKEMVKCVCIRYRDSAGGMSICKECLGDLSSMVLETAAD